MKRIGVCIFHVCRVSDCYGVTWVGSDAPAPPAHPPRPPRPPTHHGIIETGATAEGGRDGTSATLRARDVPSLVGHTHLLLQLSQPCGPFFLRVRRFVGRRVVAAVRGGGAFTDHWGGGRHGCLRTLVWHLGKAHLKHILRGGGGHTAERASVRTGGSGGGCATRLRLCAYQTLSGG